MTVEASATVDIPEDPIPQSSQSMDTQSPSTTSSELAQPVEDNQEVTTPDLDSSSE